MLHWLLNLSTFIRAHAFRLLLPTCLGSCATFVQVILHLFMRIPACSMNIISVVLRWTTSQYNAFKLVTGVIDIRKHFLWKTQRWSANSTVPEKQRECAAGHKMLLDCWRIRHSDWPQVSIQLLFWIWEDLQFDKKVTVKVTEQHIVCFAQFPTVEMLQQVFFLYK